MKRFILAAVLAGLAGTALAANQTDDAQLRAHLEGGTTFEDFFAQAELNPGVALITGSVCGVKVQEVEDPLMRQVRYLDKLVDELAKGRPMEKILRS